MSIAITITLSLLCIFIGTVVLQNAEKINELLKCKGCPCRKESWCCKDNEPSEEVTNLVQKLRTNKVRDNKGRFTKAQ